LQALGPVTRIAPPTRHPPTADGRTASCSGRTGRRDVWRKMTGGISQSHVLWLSVGGGEHYTQGRWGATAPFGQGDRFWHTRSRLFDLEDLLDDIDGASPFEDVPRLVGIAPTYGICPPPPQEPGWKAQMAWAEQKAPYDFDALVASVAFKARLSAEALEMETTRVKAVAGLVAHRALDDAIGHALEFGAVTIRTRGTSRNIAVRRSTNCPSSGVLIRMKARRERS
jgi:hypothetical protein